MSTTRIRRRLAATARPFLSMARTRRRPLLLAVGLLVLVAHPVARAGSDVFSNIGPASQLQAGALADRYPLGNYALDHHFSGVSASLLGGVDISGVPALIAYFLADVIWQLTAFLANALITLFTFAFSLDLVNGSQATGGAGALGPVSSAVRSIYQTTFGASWLVVAILAAGLWAMWKALVQRRYTETAGALGLSVVFVVIALGFVTQPGQTIGRASRWTNDMSAAFLSLSSTGSVGNEQQAKQQASDQLFHLLVYEPWVVLNFGGLEHCVKTPVNSSNPQSVPVRPLSADPARDSQLSAQLQGASDVQADGKACVNNENKYAAHFLAYPPESNDRNAVYDALSNGDPSKLPGSDPAKHTGGYPLNAVDKPAADAMGKGGQYQRLLLALVIFAGELGAFLLLGALSVAVILAQVLVLLLLAFAPVALVIGVYPGRGHDFFRGWLSRLATFLLRKAIYSLILAVLLAVAAALGDATSNLGWLLAFGLQGAFFWAVFLYRHQLTGQLTAATAGTHARAEDGTARLATLYAATRLVKRTLPSRRPTTRPGPAQHRQPESQATAAGRSAPPTPGGQPTVAGHEEPVPDTPRVGDTPARAAVSHEAGTAPAGDQEIPSPSSHPPERATAAVPVPGSAARASGEEVPAGTPSAATTAASPREPEAAQPPARGTASRGGGDRPVGTQSTPAASVVTSEPQAASPPARGGTHRGQDRPAGTPSSPTAPTSPGAPDASSPVPRRPDLPPASSQAEREPTARPAPGPTRQHDDSSGTLADQLRVDAQRLTPTAKADAGPNPPVPVSRPAASAPASADRPTPPAAPAPPQPSRRDPQEDER